MADDSGAEKVATKTDNNAIGIGNILGNNVRSQDPKRVVAPKKKHMWNNWGVIGEAHESSILTQPEIDLSSESSDWRVIMPSRNKPTEITLEVNVDGGNTGSKVLSSTKVRFGQSSIGIGSIPRNNVTSQDLKGSVATKKKHVWSHWAVIGEAHEASISKQVGSNHSSKNSDWRVIMPSNNELTEITLEVNVDEVNTVIDEEEGVVEEVALEVMKSIVYGGLNESLASLTVVTSAASADSTILSIIALALANLIGGLFILIHNLGELKDEQPRIAKNEREATVDKYKELLGQRKNFYLHAFIAIISFIVFGLVPPLVYGFSFHENGDKDFKLAAVLVASLLCITLLSIAKAYAKKSNTFMAYFKTVIYYVGNGAVGSVLSYLAGVMFKKLLEKVPWLDESSNFGFKVQGMSVQKNEWSSY